MGTFEGRYAVPQQESKTSGDRPQHLRGEEMATHKADYARLEASMHDELHAQAVVAAKEMGSVRKTATQKDRIAREDLSRVMRELEDRRCTAELVTKKLVQTEERLKRAQSQSEARRAKLLSFVDSFRKAAAITADDNNSNARDMEHADRQQHGPDEDKLLETCAPLVAFGISSIVSALHTVFMRYANAARVITASGLARLADECRILDSRTTAAAFERVMIASGDGDLTFNDFTTCLVRLARHKFPTAGPAHAMERLLQDHVLREAAPHVTRVEGTPVHSTDHKPREPDDGVLSDRRTGMVRRTSAASPVWTDTHAFLSKELMVQSSGASDAHQHEAWLLDLLEKETKEVGNVIVATADRTMPMNTPRHTQASVEMRQGQQQHQQHEKPGFCATEEVEEMKTAQAAPDSHTGSFREHDRSRPADAQSPASQNPKPALLGDERLGSLECHATLELFSMLLKPLRRLFVRFAAAHERVTGPSGNNSFAKLGHCVRGRSVWLMDGEAFVRLLAFVRLCPSVLSRPLALKVFTASVASARRRMLGLGAFCEALGRCALVIHGSHSEWTVREMVLTLMYQLDEGFQRENRRPRLFCAPPPLFLGHEMEDMLWTIFELYCPFSQNDVATGNNSWAMHGGRLRKFCSDFCLLGDELAPPQVDLIAQQLLHATPPFSCMSTDKHDTKLPKRRRHSGRLPFHHFALVLLRLIDVKYGLGAHSTMSPADKIGFLFDNLQSSKTMHTDG